MRHGRWQHGVRALAAAGAVTVSAFSCSLAMAQDAPPAISTRQQLPAEVYTATSLTPEQTSEIASFVNAYAPLLMGQGDATPEQIVQARGRLQQPLLVPNTTPAFRQAYTQAVERALSDALRSERLVVRLNAMIVASRLNYTPQVVELIIQGLQDDSPAVRYWAIKALRTSSGDSTIDGASQIRLLQELERLLDQESSTEVLEQVYQAMVDLDAPTNDALARVINSLNRRISLHIGRPLMTYHAEMIGLRAAYQKLLTAQGGRGDLFIQLARAASQYLTLLTRQAPEAQLPPEVRQSYLAMADLSYTILRQMRDQFGSQASIPSQQQFSSDLNAANWPSLRLHAEQFRDMLINPPFSLDPTDVTPTAD